MTTQATADARLPRPVRLIEQADAVCPAAAVCRAGNAVLCRVVDTVIDMRTDPSSLQCFCLNDGDERKAQGFRECPVWRAEKDAIAAGKRDAMQV